jgi:hypothetical protein
MRLHAYQDAFNSPFLLPLRLFQTLLDQGNPTLFYGLPTPINLPNAGQEAKKRVIQRT